MMIVVAVFFDVLQMILTWLVIGALFSWAVTIFGTLVFYLWFKQHGVNFVTSRRLGTVLGIGIIELVPIVNALPGWTIAVILNILYSRNEE